MRRRSFLAAMLAASAAPAIVRAASLMPVRRIIVPPALWIPEQGSGFGSSLDFENCSLWRAANHVDWRNTDRPGNAGVACRRGVDADVLSGERPFEGRAEQAAFPTGSLAAAWYADCRSTPAEHIRRFA